MYGAEQQARHHAQQRQHRGQHFVEHRLPHRHPRLQQHREVPDLVRQLVAEDGEAGAEAAHVAVSEGRPDGETVRQVVDPVPADNLGNISLILARNNNRQVSNRAHHDGHAGDGAGGGVGVAVGVAVPVVEHLVLGDDHRVPEATSL